MGQITLPNNLTDGTIADATSVMADFNTIVSDYNANINNTNVGPLGFYPSQIIPTATASTQTFGGTQNIAFPKAAVVTGGIGSGVGIQFTGATPTSAAIFSTSVAPTTANNAMNGTFVMNTGSSVQPLYVNLSGANTSGNIWAAIPVTAALPYSTQAIAGVSYTGATNETFAAPGILAAVSLTLPATSPGTSSNWRVFVKMYCNTVNAAPTVNCVVGIGSSTVPIAPFGVFANGTTTHSITGSSCYSDWEPNQQGAGTGTTGFPVTGGFSGVYANNTACVFVGLVGTTIPLSAHFNGFIEAIAIPN